MLALERGGSVAARSEAARPVGCAGAAGVAPPVTTSARADRSWSRADGSRGRAPSRSRSVSAASAPPACERMRPASRRRSVATSSAPAAGSPEARRTPDSVEVTGRRDLFKRRAAGSASGRSSIEAVARANKGLAGVLRDCKPVEADATSVTIGTQGRFHLEQISDPEKRAIIAAALSSIGGRPIEVLTAVHRRGAPPRSDRDGQRRDPGGARHLCREPGHRHAPARRHDTRRSARRDRSTVRRLPNRGPL